ncbi:leucyl aminopeptidase family protein [Allosphingosinicella indica]|uniref:Leucyl aminopeptidase n=1 Tax=Allosphingosinicella indica TaxID=941907 RepID=A0A1X7GSL0_9SPHN|nr:leucyl aminopeptidase family protein [Allosphingosinicella indica]SMF73630.1 leucyl aminopeptidase [Allosphingosinicella indica]
MTDLAPLLQADKGQTATAITLVDKSGFDAWLKAQPERVRSAVNGQAFKAECHQIAILPGDKADWSVVAGVADCGKRTPWCLARAAEVLPEGTYRIAEASPGPAALGWLLGQYVFDRYKEKPSTKGPRVLLSDDPARIAEMVAIAEATFLVRDLVNTPAGDLGPVELETAARAVADRSKAQITVTMGAELAEGYPMIAAVGVAASDDRAPRLVEIEWGDAKHPRIAIVGKGITFDTGGLDIKAASGMRLMKKDMGGAAHALALADLIIRQRLPVRLHLLLAIAENAISGAALRPGDVLTSRKGLTVEIANTDAEGRLVLADALDKAAEGEPEMILDFATLTGAARVALGPDLPALFANDETLAAALLDASEVSGDPVWRLPLWTPYNELYASDTADFGNASEGGFAGSILAALFLQRFVPDTTPWAHFDTFAWRPVVKPGRPRGGEALGLRAAWAMLSKRYGQS